MEDNLTKSIAVGREYRIELHRRGFVEITDGSRHVNLPIELWLSLGELHCIQHGGSSERITTPLDELIRCPHCGTPIYHKEGESL